MLDSKVTHDHVMFVFIDAKKKLIGRVGGGGASVACKGAGEWMFVSSKSGILIDRLTCGIYERRVYDTVVRNIGHEVLAS